MSALIQCLTFIVHAGDGCCCPEAGTCVNAPEPRLKELQDVGDSFRHAAPIEKSAGHGAGALDRVGIAPPRADRGRGPAERTIRPSRDVLPQSFQTVDT